MKVLVTGFAGQLGYDVAQELAARGISCIAADKGEFDLTNTESVRGFVGACRPDVIVHCAAYTAVDKAEEDSAACYKVNVNGTQNLCSTAKEMQAKFVYISTDYVFDGEKSEPYEVDDVTGPQTVYGSTKLEGENRVRHTCPKHFIIRTAWVFGKNGNNFVKTMLRLGKERETLNVVCDQFGSPTYTKDLARLICDMIQTDKYGTYHATNEGFCSWADFAFEIMRKAGLSTKVVPISSSEYPAKAKRPMNSRLSKQKLVDNGFTPLPDWQDALERYIKETE
ncbi:MAG: dTDP-4-dehydrorhamnose reductase [Clostridia bacterium]|nr:dTDP-4-dehydrorhamnose reductase [Clostridia bacterium]